MVVFHHPQQRVHSAKQKSPSNKIKNTLQTQYPNVSARSTCILGCYTKMPAWDEGRNLCSDIIRSAQEYGTRNTALTSQPFPLFTSYSLISKKPSSYGRARSFTLDKCKRVSPQTQSAAIPSRSSQLFLPQALYLFLPLRETHLYVVTRQGRLIRKFKFKHIAKAIFIFVTRAGRICQDVKSRFIFRI